MNTTNFQGDSFPLELAEAWSQIQRDNENFRSPYFRPEFALTVASCRDDVEIAVLEQGGDPIGFFPYQRSRKNVASPVGGIISDFQGVIVRPGTEVDFRQLLRDCGLSAFYFDHLLSSQSSFQDRPGTIIESPFIDLANGFGPYRAVCRQNGSKLVDQILRKSRKAEREMGPIRFELHDHSEVALEQLCRWKGEQYRRSRTQNIFNVDWVRKTLWKILAQQTEPFSGTLSTLYFGEKLAAVHLGMRSYETLHTWFPTYNQTLGKYSPGLICFIKLAQSSAAAGLNRIDLGKGSELYKQSLKSGSERICEGAIDFRPLSRAIIHGRDKLYDTVRRSRFRGAARISRQICFSFKERLAHTTSTKTQVCD